ncbi:MAG: ABC transporter ATP-binding protein [Burkholderiales bacterium]|nr:ABC transporter ATP-binding protein [Burkholderiales bacterium]
MSASPPLPETILDVRDVSVAYGGHAVVRGLSFALRRGAIGCLLGPSGCGKTTVLRAIAGFEPVRSGEVRLKGEVVSAPARLVPPEKRRIGMVFQDYALFPHLTVAENVAFGLRGLARRERDARVAEFVESVGLAGHAHKYPHELSGGQQQRVALARALAPQPDLLLLDEPFSNLDIDLRERLGQDVREVIKRTDTTAVLVTHDQHEAFAIADEIGIMQDGRIEQWDTPYNLYHRPATRFIADFVGQGVLVPGAVLNGREVEIELGTLTGDIPRMCEIGCDRCGRGCQVDVLLRPDDIIHDDASALKAEVVRKAFRGADILYTLRLASGREVLALVPSHHNHAIGERIGIRLEADHIVAFPPAAGPDEARVAA